MNKAEKAEIITKVTSLLKEIPSSMDIVKKGGNRHKRFEYLATHMVEKAIEKDALIISENRMGIAILFKTSKKDDNFLKDIWSQIGLVLNVTGIKNAYRIVKNQNAGETIARRAGETRIILKNNAHKPGNIFTAGSGVFWLNLAVQIPRLVKK